VAVLLGILVLATAQEAHATGDAGVINLRPERTAAWDSADHITSLDDTLDQIPGDEREQVLVRADTGACSKAACVSQRGRRFTDRGLGRRGRAWIPQEAACWERGQEPFDSRRVGPRRPLIPA
jgi:hypothetical protein